MSQTYETRRRTQDAPAAGKSQTAFSGPSLQELAAGAQPTREQLGSRVDLPGEIREKMEASFGADFSNVKLYESDTVAQAGAEAMTQGSNIAFAPGKLDLASTAGQALLGHELSHVVSQARGESAGQGFLADSGLEAQADRQGMLAAQGQSVYQGPVSPVGTSSAVGAAGPMQAKKKKDVAKDALDRGKGTDKYGAYDDAGVQAAFTRFDNFKSEQTGTRSWKELRGLGQDSNSSKKNVSNSLYSGYIAQKLLSLNGDEEAQDEFLRLFQGPDVNQDTINDYIKNDMIALTQRLGTHQNLVSEDFNTRAQAYENAKADNDLAQAMSNLMYSNGMISLGGSSAEHNLDEETQDNFRRAKIAFDADRAAAEDSLINKAGLADEDGKKIKPTKTSKQRKEYRQKRRENLGILDK